MVLSSRFYFCFKFFSYLTYLNVSTNLFRFGSTVPPQIIPFDFGEDSINEGDGVSVQCTVSKGDYPLNISWTLNGQQIEQNFGIVINRNSKRVSTLSIDNVQSIHVGNYTCLARNLASTSTYTTSLFINGTFLFSFTTIPHLVEFYKDFVFL